MTATQTYAFDQKNEQDMILRFRRMTASEAENWFDGVVYRGVRCHYPTEGGGEDG